MNLVERKNAPRQGSNAAPGTKGGKFVDKMRKLAKLRSSSRSKNPLQVGNVLTKKALPKGKASFDSTVNKSGKAFAPVKATDGQTALNPKQQGPSSRAAQKGGKGGNS